jgi:hypothetical protein
MKIFNNKGQGQMLLILLAAGVIFGGIGGMKVGSIFKSKARVAVQKDEGQKSEYYKDKIKGVEFRSEERYKMQNKGAATANATIGGKIGSFIDSSIQMIIYVVIIGVALLFFTGINIFKRFKELAQDSLRYRKALKQTVKAIDVAGPKMNGEEKVLREWLSRKQDEATENVIRELKNE